MCYSFLELFLKYQTYITFRNLSLFDDKEYQTYPYLDMLDQILKDLDRYIILFHC